MPRTVRDANLETRTARSRLAPRGKPYYRAIEPGLHLGYRKPPRGGPGKWVARYYVGGEVYQLEAIGTADDDSDADGRAVLDYRQALAKARQRMDERAAVEPGESGRSSGPLTVAQVMDAYIEFLRNDGRSAGAIYDAEHRDRAFIRPKLGGEEVAALTSKKLKRWRDDLAKAARRLRTRKGEAQKHQAVRHDGDAHRARRASANRTWTTLRSALNHAFANGDVPSDLAWRKVKPFRNVQRARVRYLTIDEAKRLINACDRDFRPIVQAALLTGARYGQVAQLTASDFNSHVGTVRLRSRKGDGSEKVYHCHLTAEGVRFFKQASVGRSGAALLFTKDDGTAWGKSHQVRPIEEASQRAKISPLANFHVTRHTWASHAVMNGTPLMVVAKALGHADTRMVEIHYGHLAPSYVADAIRAGAPKFGFRADRKIAVLRN